MQANWAAAVALCVRCAVLLASSSNLALSPSAHAQNSIGRSLPLVTQPINERSLSVLTGNTRPEALVAANDRGTVADDLPLPHMMLQLRRPAAQEQALVTLIDQLHNRKSPNYHKWLTAADIGERFGPADSDIAAVTGWLSQHGFAVNTVYTNRMVIGFSGTAGQVRTAFHTEIHNLVVNGVAHFANTSDPQIPAALAPVVHGVVSLHNFDSKGMHGRHDPRPEGGISNYTGSGTYYVTPPDLATIYNFTPLFAAGTTGDGQSIVIVASSNLYAGSDWTTFRSAFGIPISSYPDAQLFIRSPPPPSGPNNCSNPGTIATLEPTIDVEYASAGAPGAVIVLAVCATTTTDGVLIALQNLVNGSDPPAIVSNSYGECEAFLGSSRNAAAYTAYQTGAAEGVSIYVAAGDQGAAGCDEGNSYGSAPHTSSHGLNVNGYASTPYNVAVGGTDFSDAYSGVLSTYWNSSNSASGESAKSYIPEFPWNTTCGNRLLAQYKGYSTTYGSNGFCNSTFVTTQNNFWLNNWAGSGGVSACSTGAASTPGVISGTCGSYPQPSWQTPQLAGMPTLYGRALPDVSMFASFGPWNHAYILCYSDTSNGGTPCTTSASSWSYGYGGTSFGSPIWAGIQALINQGNGGRQGVPNYRLYELAEAEYATAGACNSSNGPTNSNVDCVFYDVTQGDTDVPCVADNGVLIDCLLPSGTYGALESNPLVLWAAGVGWDFATGIGTPNVANLVARWKAYPVAAHDFDSNKKSDILFRSTGASPTTVAMWLMSGHLIASSGSVASVPTSYSIVGQRDFDGDGHADLLWRDSGGNLYMWFMNGLTMSSSAGLGNVPTTWTVKGTGDMNEDGNGDILWQDSSGNVAVWFMDGSNVMFTTTLGGVDPAVWSIAATDAVGDIFWRDSSGNLAVWRITGGGLVSTVSLGNVPLNWQIAGIGDFNADYNPDILFRDSNTGTLAIWFLNSSAQVQSTATVGAVPTSSTWRIAQLGDYAGTSFSDILWIDGSGNMAIWFMNGATIASSANLGNVGTSWSVQGMNAE